MSFEENLSPVGEGGSGLSDCSQTSNEFVEPSPRPKRATRLLKRFASSASLDLSVLSNTLKGRKRKRKDVDDDNVSVQSLYVLPEREKKSKRRSSMVKMSSFVNMLSPATSRVGKALERSFSFKTPSSPPSASAGSHTPQRQITPYKKPKPACADKRTNRFWSETVDQETRSTFTSREIKRQEAIYELVQGEQDLIHDLTMVHKLYYNSMKQLKLLTDEELDSIFGIVERLVPFHRDFLSSLKTLRKADGTTDRIGDTFLQWVHNLRHYETYCANQVFAKGLLDYKKTDPKVDDFLTRCLESAFSRKLDLWNFLDLPRSRLVKYPLLLKEVYKHTDDDHADKEIIPVVLDQVEAVIKDVDDKMGESKCRQVIQHLQFLYDSQKCDLIEQSTAVFCSGQLKNERGTKQHVILFDKVLVVTRQATRNNTMRYQVVKEPIPLSDLELTDLSETEGKRGSFKNKVLRQPTTDKCAFRIFRKSSGHSHTLHARDEHDKRQWLTCIQGAVEKRCASDFTPDHTTHSSQDDSKVDSTLNSSPNNWPCTEVLSNSPQLSSRHETAV